MKKMKIEGVKDYESFKAFKAELREDIERREEAFKERLHKLDDFVDKGKRIGESVISPVRSLPIGGIAGAVGLVTSLFLGRKLKRRLAVAMGILQAVRIAPGVVRSVISVVQALKKGDDEPQQNGQEAVKSKEEPSCRTEDSE